MASKPRTSATMVSPSSRSFGRLCPCGVSMFSCANWPISNDRRPSSSRHLGACALCLGLGARCLRSVEKEPIGARERTYDTEQGRNQHTGHVLFSQLGLAQSIAEPLSGRRPPLCSLERSQL